MKLFPKSIKLTPIVLIGLILSAIILSSFMTYVAREGLESMNNGVRKEDIPEGDEDLYILKSEIVPPVCPKCPDVNLDELCPKNEKCPPCPACERCPEPAFECKKVPNYSARTDLPQPFVTDFSQF
jgi:hypothetical protein